jgi:Tfp pilus assembly protein PilO
MKSKTDKKLIILFVIIIIVIGVAFYFLNKQEKENSTKIKDKSEQEMNIKIIERKKAKIEALTQDMKNIFSSEEFKKFTDTLVPYIDLPINVGRVNNPNPFGTYQSEE